jgi:hypothetical protein
VTTVRPRAAIPEDLGQWFWDVDVASLSWATWREFIIGRLLRSGDWRAVQWLLTQVTLPELAQWLQHHRGGGLSAPRLRYWQLILDLQVADVNAWIAKSPTESWGARPRR